ncbi:Reverse transcriptase (RNA-dependent DNA polymerase) [Rubripirellula tenax]|uniref:RNA-directed DNA polymerase n=1 Tax=Rubripirellula tenax TaxID=2528015 RepID=A0A5C6FF12_9BACT|nr:reverse transcriptase family protein [Rubripirellula tenax]TWU58706.1 Reverse transcriptase (RNA-dependent DNA polymerase) [Rubripirellula tenax]
MTDSTTRQVVSQLVLNQVAAGAMFTAYDITLQARGRGMQLRHGEGRDLVHELFNTGRMGTDYTRTVVDLGTDANPMVYHRRGDSPRTYQSGSTGATAASAPPGALPTQPFPPAAAPPANTPGLIGRLVKGLFGGGKDQPIVGRVVGDGGNAASGDDVGALALRPPASLDLDASDFLPISRDDLMSAAKTTTLWGNPWFGRRDIIPPIGDPRTKLIDRAMVARGILTPDQLAEIHRIGADMDHYRPTQILIESQAHSAGRSAIEVDDKRKAEEKAKKKAEAKERKEKRQSDIAERKATDIVFLGRGVSGQLHLRDSDAEKLAAADLPILSTPAELASALGLTISKLRWLAFHNDVATRTHYVRFEIPKRSGGTRQLSSPHKLLAEKQRWILKEILNKLPVEDSAHGFVRDRDILTNAIPHVGKDVVLNMDLENFFPSIGFPRVRQVFKGLGYSPAVATILALLCTESPRRAVTYAGQPYLVASGPRGLPQGACTSPAISNQVAKRLDRRVQGLATKFGVAFTRYADDMTVSGGAEMTTRIGYMMAKLRHIAEDEGFVINRSKTRVLRRNTAQIVTGLVVNDKPTVSRTQLRRIRAILHHAHHDGLSAQNREQHANFRAWMQGMIAFVAMTRPELAKDFLAQLQSVRD